MVKLEGKPGRGAGPVTGEQVNRKRICSVVHLWLHVHRKQLVRDVTQRMRK